MARSWDALVRGCLPILLLCLVLSILPGAEAQSTAACPCKINKRCATAEQCKEAGTVIGAVLGTLFGGAFLGLLIGYICIGRIMRKRCCVCNVKNGKHGPTRRMYCISPEGCCATEAQPGAPCWADHVHLAASYPPTHQPPADTFVPVYATPTPPQYGMSPPDYGQPPAYNPNLKQEYMTPATYPVPPTYAYSTGYNAQPPVASPYTAPAATIGYQTGAYQAPLPPPVAPHAPGTGGYGL